MRQLNKGEALHDLRAYLMIANKGQVRRKRSEELANQASCLNLVTNAVIVWPTRYEHLNVYGCFHFSVEEARGRKGLRPLRGPNGRIP